MIPEDLSPFSVEQLNGFKIAVTQEINALRAEANDDADKLARLEKALDKLNVIEAAITTLEANAAAEVEVDEAIVADDSEGTDDVDAPVADTEAVLEEAVASAAMGGGDRPRISVTERDNANGDVQRFMRNMASGNNGGVRTMERHAFSTMRRETNTVVREGQNATEAIREAIAGRAAGTDKTAAGCFCGPDDAITAIKQCGETVRPFSDTLPTLTASGDVRYIRQIDLADALTGVTQWTCADQDDVDPSDIATWKPCFELACEPEITSAMYAVPACASFSTQQFIGNPDLIANLEHVMQVAYNKTAELLAYNAFKALATPYNPPAYVSAAYGAGAQLVAAVGWYMELVAANLRETNPQYTLTIPAGLKQRILTDGFLLGARSVDETWSVVTSRLAELGVNRVVELVDEITGVPAPLAHATVAAPGGPIAAGAPHPVVQEIALYRPEDFLLGVAPELDLGVTRSPELARQNKLQWFTESFEFVEKPGCAPASILQLPFCANGIRPALGEGLDCED